MKQSECKNRFPIFKERFIELRGNKSNTEFAEFLGMSRQTVGFYINGERIPDILGLRQIAEKCNVSADWLIGLSKVKSVEPEVKNICNYTGLSQITVERLHIRNDDFIKVAAPLIDEIMDWSILPYREYALRSAFAMVQVENNPKLRNAEKFIETLENSAHKLINAAFSDDPKDINYLTEIPVLEAAAHYEARAVHFVEKAVRKALLNLKETIKLLRDK